MTESDAREARQSPVRLRYKIIAYVATWTAALLLIALDLLSTKALRPRRERVQSTINSALVTRLPRHSLAEAGHFFSIT